MGREKCSIGIHIVSLVWDLTTTKIKIIKILERFWRQKGQVRNLE
jgi:hypothetical protein